MKYTRTNLKKLEDLCQQIGYKVRYEQGHFQSGYCRVEARKILIINKFFDVEGRMNCLFELIPILPIDSSVIDEDALKNYQKIIDLRPQEEKLTVS
ncbi:MAG: hypothetical protein IPK88_19470 [Saprospiraceae bacterium]|nr:hypothetical protein [Candidatus Defluviibacterium haderslevense]